MKKKYPEKKPHLRALVTGLSAVALSVSASFAQETQEEQAASNDADNVEVIEVKGIRSSIQSAQALKKNADTFVDAITAADIGALPDRSVSEALQRLPGLNIVRFAGPNDPNRFSVEGSGVVIRGLPFVRSELNGRDVFGAGPGGVLGFEDVSPELLGSVQVFKNQSADHIEGGLAGTIDLKTRLPFDQEGQLVSFSAEGNYSDLADEVTPAFSGLYSNQFETDSGRWGFLGNVSFNEINTRADGTQIFSYDPIEVDGQTLFVPAGAGIRQQNFDRERFGIALAGQWESTDKKWLASFQFLRSDAGLESDEFSVETQADDGAIQGDARANIDRSDFVFDDNGIFQSGTIVENAQWRGPNATAALVGLQDGTNGGQQAITRRNRFEDDLTTDYGFNLKFSPTDSLRLNFDVQYLDAESQITDVQVFGSGFSSVRIGERVNDVPEVSFGGFESVFVRAALDHITDNEADSFAVRSDVEYDFQSDGWLKSVRGGVRYNQQDTTIRQSDFNWGNISEVWTGRDIQGNSGGNFDDFESVLLTSGNSNPELENLVSPLFSTFDFGDFQRGSNTGISGLPFFNGPFGGDFNGFQNTIANILQAIGGSASNSGSAGGEFAPLAFRTAADGRFETVIPGTPFLLSEVGNVERDNLALYARFDYGIDDFLKEGVTLDGNFGVRYVRTDRSVDTFINSASFGALFPQSFLCDPNDPRTIEQVNSNPEFTVPGFCALGVDQLEATFGEGGIVTDTVDVDYDEFLPSFNAKLGLTDEHIVRFAWSRTLTRPGVDQLNERIRLQTLPDINNGVGVPRTFGGFVGNQTGNANLLPQLSSNFDLSWEWYFDDAGSVTVSGFYKDLSDPIIASALSTTFGNGFEAFRPTQVTSSENGTLQGFEVAYQQFYDFLPGLLSGLGFQFNYTYIDAELPPPSVPDELGAFVDDPPVAEFENDQSIFPRVSDHNLNLIGLYEKGSVQARVAWNWRSEFLVTERNVIFPFASVFQPATGQLDASVFYTINGNIKVGIQGVNLLDDITVTQDSLTNDGLRGNASFFRNDRRVTAILRATF